MINLTSHALLFTLAAIGVSETSYLIRKRMAAEKPVCPIGEDCGIVLNSKYNKLFFGIHNEIIGILFYALFAAIMALIVIDIDTSIPWLTIIYFFLVAASIMSLIFTYLQWQVIKAWCFWCIMSAATIGLMDLIVITSKIV